MGLAWSPEAEDSGAKPLAPCPIPSGQGVRQEGKQCPARGKGDPALGYSQKVPVSANACAQDPPRKCSLEHVHMLPPNTGHWTLLTSHPLGSTTHCTLARSAERDILYQTSRGREGRRAGVGWGFPTWEKTLAA